MPSEDETIDGEMEGAIAVETIRTALVQSDADIARRREVKERDVELERQKRDILDTGHYFVVCGVTREQVCELLDRLGLGAMVDRSGAEPQFLQYIHADEIAHQLGITLTSRHPDFRPTRINRKLRDLALDSTIAKLTRR